MKYINYKKKQNMKKLLFGLIISLFFSVSINAQCPGVDVDTTALQDKTIFQGSGTSFTITSVSASSASSSVQYQWQEDGVDLTNTGVYSGTDSIELTISDVTGLDSKVYSLVVSHLGNVCFLSQDSATLTVIEPCSPQPSDPTLNAQWMQSDCDGDGLNNGDEVAIGTDPNVFEDNDNDGTADHFDPDNDNDGIPNFIECGYGQGFINGGFELGENGCNGIFHESMVDGWSTTATDEFMEIWCDGRVLSGITYNAREGARFAQVNANQTASIYQTVATTPGTFMVWSVSHLARGTGIESINIRAGGSIDSTVILETQTATRTMWQDYSGVYLVPSGQTETVFIIEAQSGGTSGNLVRSNFFPKTFKRLHA